MTRRQHTRLFWSAAAILAALHVDTFNHHPAVILLWGWMPFDLAYHILWIVAATGLVFYLTRKVWQAPA